MGLRSLIATSSLELADGRVVVPVEALEEWLVPKPDGWHVYHVCGDKLRELTWSGHTAICVVCGQAFTGPSSINRFLVSITP